MKKTPLVLTVIIFAVMLVSANNHVFAQVLSDSSDSVINHTVRNIYTRVVALETQVSQLLDDVLDIRSHLHGAGNIAFCSLDHGCTTVLKVDGTIWSINGQGNWDLVTDSVPNSLPVNVGNIIVWNPTQLLDRDGDVWRWVNNSWSNFGHP